MDTNKMREQFEKRIHQPAGSYWCEKDRTYRYEDYDTASSQIHECQWQAWIVAWQASREAVVVELPPKISAHNTTEGGFIRPEAEHYDEAIDDCREAIEAQGLKVEVKP
ncbi:hypothetical protein [Pseudomonas soli]|uniref:hypothetical protein n=1 Tax=Pseudomonas soli TaxID=1306993 RepID=UPI00299E464C|nr:hypothetical protein [Pseudomonas soli]MDW9406333.1 hypothetical protein [Pseudomonas soli]